MSRIAAALLFAFSLVACSDQEVEAAPGTAEPSLGARAREAADAMADEARELADELRELAALSKERLGPVLREKLDEADERIDALREDLDDPDVRRRLDEARAKLATKLEQLSSASKEELGELGEEALAAYRELRSALAEAVESARD